MNLVITGVACVIIFIALAIGSYIDHQIREKKDGTG